MYTGNSNWFGVFCLRLKFLLFSHLSYALFFAQTMWNILFTFNCIKNPIPSFNYSKSCLNAEWITHSFVLQSLNCFLSHCKFQFNLVECHFLNWEFKTNEIYWEALSNPKEVNVRRTIGICMFTVCILSD